MIEAAGQEVQTPDIAPDEIARVDPSQDVRRVGTAKMGTKVKPRETTQDDNLTLEHAFNVIPPKKLKVQIDGMAKRPEIPAAVRQVRDPKKRAERMIEFFKENLLALHDAFPAELRARATHWYDGANKIASDLANQWGLTLEQAGGIIAVLSPQKDWFMNVAQARQATEVYLTQADSVIEGPDFDRVFDENIDGLSIDKKALAKHRKATGRPDLTKAEALDIARATRRAVFDALKGQTIAGLDHNPGLQAWAIRMTAEAKMGREFHIISPEGETMGVQMSRKTGEPVKNGWGPTPEIVKLVSIIKDGSLKNISEQLGQKHKVRNFFNNIVAPNNSKGDSTMDTHAVAAAHLLPLGSSAPEVSANFGSTGSPGNGVNGTYYLYQEAYRRAALERGLQPRQMQSITWEAIRGLFLPEDRRGAIVPATRKHWKDHANDPDTARAKLLERPIVPPFWADRDGDGQ